MSLRPAGIEAKTPHESASDLEIFFGLFARRQLAIEIFTIMEDLRLDEWTKRRYAGLRNAFEKIQRAALYDRPSLAGRGPRDLFAEIMVRISLAPHETVNLPSLLHTPVRQLQTVMRTLCQADARVEDSAEAAMRAYCLIIGLPNLAADGGPSLPIDESLPLSEPEWPTAWPEPENNRLEGDDVMATVITAVAYRDQLGSRYTHYKGAGPLD